MGIIREDNSRGEAALLRECSLPEFRRRVLFLSDDLGAAKACWPAFLAEPTAGGTNGARRQCVDDSGEYLYDPGRQAAICPIEVTAGFFFARRGEPKYLSWTDWATHGE